LQDVGDKARNFRGGRDTPNELKIRELKTKNWGRKRSEVKVEGFRFNLEDGAN